MKERPILFSGPLVRALLAGTKTQTRRLCKPAVLSDGTVAASVHPDGAGNGWIAWATFPVTAEETRRLYPGADGFRCPHGAVGDRLWVRETWASIDDHIEYRADSGAKYPGDWPDDEGDDAECPRWKPSIHMRRRDSRIDLEIVEVRVQRLQDITEEDARAEGFDPAAPQYFPGEKCDDDREDPREVGYPPAGASFARDNFRRAWDVINGKRSPWDRNDWVWAISFRRIRP